MSDDPTLIMKQFIARIADGENLSEEDASAAFEVIMSGEATPSQLGGFLMALRMKGETVEEINGAASIMRAKALTLEAPDGAIDIVGTGGDASGTYNISTAAAIVVAGCGVTVAKHGNKALSSKSGAADVLTSLGVNIQADMAKVAQSIHEAGIGFMMAPRHHSAMKHVMPTRMELGTRTIFNLLGPLSNPAGVKRQMTGVFAPHWVEPFAHVLNRLGAEKAWIVHGSDGLDEITTTGPTHVAELKDGTVRTFTITPEDAGLILAAPEDLKGGSPEVNAKAALALLDGEKSAYRDVVLLNAAASLIVADKVETLKDGVAMAAEAIDSGAARKTLDTLSSITQAED